MFALYFAIGMINNLLSKVAFLMTTFFVVSLYSKGQVIQSFIHAGVNQTTITHNQKVIANPTITLTDITDLNLSTVQGSPVSQTLNVSGVNLSADLGLVISGTDAGLFSLSQYSVPQTGGDVPNTIVTITYTPSVPGSSSVTLMVSSPGAMVVARTLNGTASIATDISVPATSFIVSVRNGNVLFAANAGEYVEIYNSIGQVLVQKTTVDGMNSIPVTVHGLLLVKIGSRVTKVIL